MNFRKFGKLDWKVSSLALGLGGLSALKENAAVKVIRTAVDSGVNLIDLGWPLAENNNEHLFSSLKTALGDGYRDKVKIAASIPADGVKATADFEKALESLLKSLRSDKVDFLLLDSLNRFTWPRLQNLDILKSLEKALTSKQADYIGFSFHDQYQFLRDIVTAWDGWTLCRFQYSFMDIDHHPGYGGLKYAADNGLAVIAAKPLLGGRLVKNIPGPITKVWDIATPKRPPAEWALRWVWNHPEISSVVCDMDSPAQVKENALLADAALPDSFSVPEELVIGKAREAYLASRPIPCTACRGCMPTQGPCPQGIDVPRVFEIYNDAVMYNDVETARFIYRREHHGPGACNECGTCVCGKNIPIPDWLKKAGALLGNG
jgi:uncharacterized protein